MEIIPENSLVLTNTLFSQKMESPEKVQKHIAFDGMVHLDLYRNQIDYIICENIHKELF